jgi:hypothetical protein
MHVHRRVDLVFGVFALPILFSGAIANAGTVRGMDWPHRVPWAFRVKLKRERIISFKGWSISTLKRLIPTRQNGWQRWRP